MLINSNNKEYAEIYQVAHMYYELNMLQSEIADKLYLSRPKVSRLLTQARELGIVEIKVNPIINRLEPLEKKLCTMFGLKDSIVITNDTNKLELVENIAAQFSAHYISQLLKKGGVLGITNGATINNILGKIQFNPEVSTEIVQLMGQTANTFSLQDTTLILSRLASESNTLAIHTLSAPLYVNDLYLKEVIMQEPSVHTIMQKMMKCTTIITDILPMEKDSDYHISWHGQMGPYHVAELIDRGAVGSICAQYFNKNGIKVTSEWNAKTISMNINDFTKADYQIGIAMGLDKLQAILGALRGRLINVLITDANTASDLIEMEKKPQRK